MPSPFLSPAHRMARDVDEIFFQSMAADKAVVRLIGPRRIGKTELVTYFTRVTEVPFLNVTIPTLPTDSDPAQVVVNLLETGISSLKVSCPSLAARYSSFLEQEQRPETKRKTEGEITFGLPHILKAKVSSAVEHGPAAAAKSMALTSIGPILRRFELAAIKQKVRPVVLFDEIQELVLRSEPKMSTIWAIRNEAQNHTACRYVFAGSNQRLFAQLQSGALAPLLHLGSAIEIPPVSLEEIDEWALPLFKAGKRQVRSFSILAKFLAGKIGEIAVVLDWIWKNTKPGDFIDDELQRNAIFMVSREAAPMEENIRALTPTQTAVLRWILQHPGQSPYKAGSASKLNPGAVSKALETLVVAGLIEAFGKQFAATSPLQTMRSLEIS